MEDKLFDTPEKIEVAKANFLNLMQHPGWKLLEEIVNANIEHITEQILVGGNEELMNQKRENLRAMKNIINTPRDQIKTFELPDLPDIDPDPYDKPKPVDPEIEEKA